MSLCSDCIICHNSQGPWCLAGNGDDDFIFNGIDKVNEMIKTGFRQFCGERIKITDQEIEFLKKVSISYIII